MIENIKIIIAGFLIGFLISTGINITKELNSINDSLSKITIALQEQNTIFNTNPDEVENEKI